MRKNIVFIALSLAAILLLSQCNNRVSDDADGYGKEYPRTKESFAIIDSCMSFMQTDPAKSHSIIDSVCEQKLMSPQRCDYFHAMVLYQGEEKHDTALAICNTLLDEGEFGDDKYLEEELCVLASNITFSTARYLETLKYANRGIAICHGQELMNNDEATLMGRVGEAEQMLGRMKEAEQTYADANELLKKDNTFGGLIARISLMMKQAVLYDEAKEYDKAIAVRQKVLNIVEAFHLNPSSVEVRPKSMTESGDATREFADFYQSQMYGRIAQVYHKKIEHENPQDASAYLDSVNIYLDKWEQTQSCNTPMNLAKMIRELYFTGRKAEFNAAKEAVETIYKSDSIVSNYVDYLSLLAEDAASRRDFQSSTAYLQRALAISDSIRQQETLRTLSEQMSINMVQQQQLARQEAESKAALYKMIIVIIVIVVVAGIVIIILRHRNKEKDEILYLTQQDLIETQEEVNDIMHQLEEARQERQTKDMNELYAKIMNALTEKELYCNPDLSIIMLADVMGTNRSFVSSCINTVTGKPFRAWLAEYRLNKFVELQKKNPEASIDQLLPLCGYKDQSTFRRHFKATFGTSPSKYKQE